jgi:hypothetical protein
MQGQALCAVPQGHQGGGVPVAIGTDVASPAVTLEHQVGHRAAGVFTKGYGRLM